MDLNVIVYGFLLFFCCLIIHIIIWRIKVPLISSFVLLVIFLVIPFIFSVFVIKDIWHIKDTLSLNTVEVMGIMLLHFSLSSAYIAGYPAVRAVSPTLDIILMIESSKYKKMTEEELKRNFTDKRLVHARIDDLRTYHLISEKDDIFKLTFVSKIIVVVFILYRKILGLPMGEG